MYVYAVITDNEARPQGPSQIVRGILINAMQMIKPQYFATPDKYINYKTGIKRNIIK